MTRRRARAAAVVVAAALGGASVAWACSPFQPTVEVRGSGNTTQTSGPAGTELTFSGRDFAPGSTVEVRWDARSGALLAQGSGPSFSVPITIPNTATVGVHYIMAVPSVGNAASLAFEVTRSPNTTPKASTSPGAGTSTAGANDEEASTASGSTQQAGSGERGATTSAADASGQSGTVGTRTDTGTASAPATGGNASAPSAANDPQASGAIGAPTASSASAPGRPAVGAAVRSDLQVPASANPAVVATPGGQAVFAGSSAPAPAEVPSAASVSGDTWSGFAAGSVRPSLLTHDLPGTEPSSEAPLGAGVALLGAGLVALFAGFALAEMRRKRVRAGAERRS